MKMRVLTRVMKVSLESRYPKKEDDSVDYLAPKVEYFLSNLEVLDNELGIRGSIQVEEKLQFGVLYEIFVDTSHHQQVAQIEEVTDAEIVESEALDESALDSPLENG